MKQTLRERKPYIPLTPEQIRDAQHTDLVAFLRARGEEFRKEGSQYVWLRHPSCYIQGFMWYQHSQTVGGAAVSFMQRFYNLEFPLAVLALNGAPRVAAIERQTIRQPQPRRSSQPKAIFSLPHRAPDNRRLFAYLTKTRGISPDIVNDLLEEKVIYQDQRGNVVFLCFDQQGYARAAHLCGTNTAVRFKGFQEGGDSSCGFSVAQKNATRLFVFEAPIDLMSFITLRRHEPWHRDSYLSLGGLYADPLKRFLREHPTIREIYFCLDNDADAKENHGELYSQELMGYYQQRYIVQRCRPALKDWNAVLKERLKK